MDKGQLVSEAIFSWRQISQKASNIFRRIFALASKRGSIKKNAHHHMYKEYVLCSDILLNNGSTADIGVY